MPPPKYYARIHCIIAREAPVAVVFRRGPAKKTLVLKWDIEKGIFKKGQWLKGRIYHQRSDISPDGKKLFYMGMGVKGPFSAVSRLPYLKALEFFLHDSTWFGGGLWLSSDSCVLDQGTLRTRLAGCFSPAVSRRVLADETLPPYGLRLLRDGWECLDWGPPNPKKRRFDKKINSEITLRKIVAAWKADELPDEFTNKERGYNSEYHQLIKRDKVIAEYANWEWAEIYSSRTLLYAEEGCLYRAQVSKDGAIKSELIKDLNPYTYERLVAPY